jgi:hypothetical protein
LHVRQRTPARCLYSQSRVKDNMKLETSSSFDPKNKVISFRLSDAEYELASDFCKASGYRGMSMLARSAFLAFLPQEYAHRHQQDDPAALRGELKLLHAELARLISSLNKIQEQIGTDVADEAPLILSTHA